MPRNTLGQCALFLLCIIPWRFDLDGAAAEIAHSLQNVCFNTSGRMCIATEMFHMTPVQDIEWMTTQPAHFPQYFYTSIASRVSTAADAAGNIVNRTLGCR